ncbi:MAG: hypothetical protein MJE77_24525 [Proteobacteria bacterium]|nr:hypothetical protein [Pseudomonadota bacterium]
MSTDVFVKPVDSEVILLSTTFGLLISSDNGATFRWICEEAVGYGGVFDPDYAIGADGTIFAGTPDALMISSDGCAWNPAAGDLAQHWVADIERGPDGELWVATSTTARPNDVYLSDDNGQIFAAKNMRSETAFWRSVRVAASNPQRVYVTGYTQAQSTLDGGVGGPEPLFYRSDNGGESWMQIDLVGVEFGPQPLFLLHGVDPTDPDVVFARSVGANGVIGDFLYRSDNGGTSWAKVLETGTGIRAFVIRKSGDIIVGTVNNDADMDRVFVSTNGGVGFSPAAQQPQMGCIAEDENGRLLACGANWEPDFFALGSSSDGVNWTKLVRFSEMKSAYSCPAETLQASLCESRLWPTLCEQFACNRGSSNDVDAGPSGDGSGNDGGGCCDAGAGAAGSVILTAATGLLLLAVLRRRRSKPLEPPSQ